MTRRFAKHNIVGNEVGKALTFEFSGRRPKRGRRHRARRRKFWFSALLLAMAIVTLSALRGLLGF